MKPDIIIFFGESEYLLRPTVGSLIRVEDELDKPISQITSRLGVKEAAVFVKHTIKKATGEALKPEEWIAIVEGGCELDDMLNAARQVIERLAPTTKKKEGEPVKN